MDAELEFGIDVSYFKNSILAFIAFVLKFFFLQSGRGREQEKWGALLFEIEDVLIRKIVVSCLFFYLHGFCYLYASFVQ